MPESISGCQCNVCQTAQNELLNLPPRDYPSGQSSPGTSSTQARQEEEVTSLRETPPQESTATPPEESSTRLERITTRAVENFEIPPKRFDAGYQTWEVAGSFSLIGTGILSFSLVIELITGREVRDYTPRPLARREVLITGRTLLGSGPDYSWPLNSTLFEHHKYKLTSSLTAKIGELQSLNNIYEDSSYDAYSYIHNKLLGSIPKILDHIEVTWNEIFNRYQCPHEIDNCVAWHPDNSTYRVHTALVGEDYRVPIRITDSVPLDADRQGNRWHGNSTTDYRTCVGCDYYVHIEQMSSDLDICISCQNEAWSCDNCGTIGWGNDNLNVIEEWDEEEDETYESSVCSVCFNNWNTRLSLRNYSFTPEFVFNKLEEETGNPLYMGMELEVARLHREDAAPINGWIKKVTREGFLYVKSDSSVNNGMEIVTHPFTYDWAKGNFPFNRFEELLELEPIISTHSTAGTHIHLSKDAFTKSHMWKFVLFFLENADFLGVLGGRGATASYGPLKGEGPDDLRDKLKFIVDTKDEPDLQPSIRGGRNGVHITHANTIEMRFLAGNIKTEAIRKNIQLMRAAFDYTARVKSSDALKGALNDPGYFMGFLEKYNYTELEDVIQKSFPSPRYLEGSN